jgi:RimJ/RimL family protein N-acetyltransferase
MLQGEIPAIEVPAVLPSARLSYHLLDEHNEGEMLAMFTGDDNPFVQPDFKQAESLAYYVDNLWTYSRHSVKRAGRDWLLREGEWGPYVGVLHLYDLSLDPFHNSHRKCTIGFAIRDSARRQGYASEAVGHLLQFLRQELGQIRVLAYTATNNAVSQAFLIQQGFVAVPAGRYHGRGRYAYFEWWWEEAERLADAETIRAFRLREQARQAKRPESASAEDQPTDE